MRKTSSASPPQGQNAGYFSARLRQALKAVGQSPLTVVEAPMGYGKTEAVKEFLRLHPARSIWTTAREFSPESFWPDFCRGLREGLPQAGEISAALARLGLPGDAVTAHAARELLRQLAPAGKTVLVFDDCHFLPPSFMAFCESLAQDILPDMRLVCLTRNAWEGNKNLLRLKKFLTYIDRNTLALTPGEIREYYAVGGVSLSLETAHELHERTGGWIGALSPPGFSQNPREAGTPAAALALLKEQVYDRLSEKARELLYVVAPLERFTATQALRLYGKDPAPLLRELTGKNAFIVFDPGTLIYTPHSLFRRLLLDMLEKDGVLSPERQRDIYRACGEVHLEAGEISSAMAAWHKAKDFERALAVLGKDMARISVMDRPAVYMAMFKDCPEEIWERHLGAAFKYALAAFITGDFQAFGEQIEWLSPRCPPPDESSADEARRGDEARRWRGELHTLLALAEFNDLEAMGAHHRQALALLEGPTGLYGPNSSWTFGNPSVMFLYYRESGKLQDTLRQMRECLPLYHQLAFRHGAGAEYLLEAEALYHAGEFAKAEPICRTALDMAEQHRQAGNVLCAYFLQMRLALLAGDGGALFGDGERDGLISAMRGLINRNRESYLLYTADLGEGWLYAALGLPQKIPAWLRFKTSKDKRLNAPAKGFFHLVYGRALLLAGEYADAVKDFTESLAKGIFGKHPLFSVYAHIYLAVAFHMTGRGREGATVLKTALDTALPDALYMPFAENYDLCWPLLPQALSGKKRQKILPRLEALAGQMKIGREAALLALAQKDNARPEARRPARKTAPDKLHDKLHHFAAGQELTRRETEVLSCILRKLSVTEIAGSLALTHHTVKYHITNIMRKTKVARRRQLLPLYADWKVV
jgi:LuxR family maltose regulon positive regulatory protein